MTDNEILATGELCEALLASDHFKTVVTEYELTIAADILATARSDSAQREELYASLWGTRGLRDFMVLKAQAAQHIKNEQNQPPLDSTTDPIPVDVDDYDDEGFLRAETDY